MGWREVSLLSQWFLACPAAWRLRHRNSVAYTSVYTILARWLYSSPAETARNLKRSKDTTGCEACRVALRVPRLLCSAPQGRANRVALCDAQPSQRCVAMPILADRANLIGCSWTNGRVRSSFGKPSRQERQRILRLKYLPSDPARRNESTSDWLTPV